MFRFAYPYFLILIPVFALLLIRRQKDIRSRRSDYLRVGTVASLSLFRDRNAYKVLLPLWLKGAAIFLLICALARPQIGKVSRELKQKGIDIMLALDISGSMRAVDFKPNRLEASKQVAADFVNGRKTDRIGLVVFGSESFLQCPLTIDYSVLDNIIGDIKIVPEEYDGTAIGLAISNAINRLRDSDAESKVIILLSDGANNSGDVDPLTAADFAKKYNIKIYTIGMGKDGQVLMPVQNSFFGGTQMVPVNSQIDEKLLREIADKTGGAFFRADTEEKLKSIWQEISKMEKTEIKTDEYLDWGERYDWFLIPALTLFVAGFLLSRYKWSVYP